MNVRYILDEMDAMFPNAQCELTHKNTFELLIAVILSAPTTDEAVNKVTPALFDAYPTPALMAAASVDDISKYIKRIGLYRNKASNIKACSQMLVDSFEGQVPSTRKTLMRLSGVGRKTANVVLSVAFNIPAIAVDTHVERVSKRLGFAKFADDVTAVEQKLKRKIPRDEWNHSHHLFIFFGRYHCTARNPKCDVCPFVSFCKIKAFEQYKRRKDNE